MRKTSLRRVMMAAVILTMGLVGPTTAGIWVGCIILVLIALTVNSTHSLVGAAAPPREASPLVLSCPAPLGGGATPGPGVDTTAHGQQKTGREVPPCPSTPQPTSATLQ